MSRNPSFSEALYFVDSEYVRQELEMMFSKKLTQRTLVIYWIISGDPKDKLARSIVQVCK